MSEPTSIQESARQKPALWTKQFVTLTLASFLLFLNLQMLLSTFSMHIKSNLHGGDMQVSLATSVFAVTAIVARLLTSSWIKRWSKDAVLTAGLIIAAASTALAALPESVAPLLVMRAIYGLGFGIGSTVIPTLVSQIIPPQRMGEGIGYFGLSTSLAMSIGPATGMSIMKEYGFTTLAIIGVGAVLCMFPMLLLSGAYKLGGKRKEAAASQQAQRMEQADMAKQASAGAVRSRSIWRFTILFPALLNMLISITYSGILSFIAVYGEELQLAQVGLFFMFNALTILLVRPIAGKIFDRKGPLVVLLPAAAFVIVSMIVLSYTTNMLTLIVSALLYGAGFGSIQPTLQAWMLRSASKEQYGVVNGIFYNATDLGVSIGAIVLGVIVTFSSYSMMYRLSSLFMVIFLLAIAGFAWKQKSKAQDGQSAVQ
ncbi:MFS transporter [Paenibacillus montaniterrae]|uniref:MFS transporter n=1 Tax=Paenibacillus montaniterrae TaxID=429341 RepID=A0A919YUC9_9BACL|nr:MFS transporter [Paenibacillus montaniterrae]GIP18599.1 MFS transporter [Paenibacillus montaniterrae]